MSFPRYPEYKDSGVEWLGEVPVHWEIAPFFSKFTERSESNCPVPDDNLDIRLGRLMESRALLEQLITELSGGGSR